MQQFQMNVPSSYGAAVPPEMKGRVFKVEQYTDAHDRQAFYYASVDGGTPHMFWILHGRAKVDFVDRLTGAPGQMMIPLQVRVPGDWTAQQVFDRYVELMQEEGPLETARVQEAFKAQAARAPKIEVPGMGVPPGQRPNNRRLQIPGS